MSVELQRGNDVPQCHKCQASLMGRQYLIQVVFCVNFLSYDQVLIVA